MLQLLDSANKQLSSFTKSPDHIDVNTMSGICLWKGSIRLLFIYLFIFWWKKFIFLLFLKS